MASDFNETKNYIWNICLKSDCIGEGANGRVYRGVHKTTGDAVAVKTFKAINLASQEIKVLQTLSHPNIIKLHDVENEISSAKKVMILELCNARSLMDFLNEPANTYGLLDDEFMLVLEHLSSGLEYLRKHNIIHRDVKPGNIMRHINFDGTTSYKLGDFGSARELPDGENFYSLHGTEPYLNPEIYQQAFLRTEIKKSFGSNTDLWSIGVTLYQMATGSLPFPNQDRRIRLKIYHNMRQHEDIVAAVEFPAGSNKIIYYNRLPQWIRLSSGLKELITPLIAGLFIQEPKKQWSFSQYYEQVLDLVSRRKINVFYLNKMQILPIYMKSDETFSDFKRYVHQHSTISQKQQLFFYKQTLIVNRFQDFHDIGSECVILVGEKDPNLKAESNLTINAEQFSNFKAKFSNPATDYNFARRVYKELWVCKSVMDYQSMVYKCVDTFTVNFTDFCKETVKEYRLFRDYLFEFYLEITRRVNILKKMQDLSGSSSQISSMKFQTTTDNFLCATNKLFDDLETAKTNIKMHTLHDSYLKTVTKELSNLDHLIKELPTLEDDKKLYKVKKIKIVYSVEKILEIFTNVMHPDFEKFLQESQNWYTTHFFARLRDLTECKKQTNGYKYDLKKFQDELDSRGNDNLNCISTTRGTWKKMKKMTNHRQTSVGADILRNESTECIMKMDELISWLESTVTELRQEIGICD